MKNPTLEIRIPKQIRKDGLRETTSRARAAVFLLSNVWNLFRISTFGFRISARLRSFAWLTVRATLVLLALAWPGLKLVPLPPALLKPLNQSL